MEDFEGTGTVVKVASNADMEYAHIEVRFDEEDDPGPYYRLVLPHHVLR